MSNATSSSPLLTTQSATIPEVTEQGQPSEEGSYMEGEPAKGPSDVPSNQSEDQIVDEKGTAAVEGSADQPEPDTVDGNDAERAAETLDTKGTDAVVDPGEGAHNPAPSGEPSGLNPVPSTNKPKPKSIFVKIVELESDDMVTARSAAFFGKSYDIWGWLTPLPIGSPP